MTESSRRMTHLSLSLLRRSVVPVRWRGSRNGIALAALSVMVLGVMTGCLSDKSISTALQTPEETLGQGVVWPLNTIMAVGDTQSVQLHVKTLTGTPVTTFDSVVYVLLFAPDSQYISVSRTGVLTARQPTLYPVNLWVFGFKGAAVAMDVATIQVTQDALPAATLSIAPVAPDSARWPIFEIKQLNPIVRDSITGNTVSGVQLRLEFGPNDSSNVVCYSGYFGNGYGGISEQETGKNPCTARGNYYSFNALNDFIGLQASTIWVYANVYAYGRMLRDSVQFTLINPPTRGISFSPVSLAGNGGTSPLNTSISPGGRVTFSDAYDSSFGTSINVVFEHPEGATGYPTDSSPSGNITGLTSTVTAVRQFLTPGVYNYTFTIVEGAAPFKGVTGKGAITVQ